MKKLLKIGLVILVIMIIFSSIKDNGKQNTSNQENKSFSKKDAITSAQGYEIKENIESLGEPTVGMYLSVYLEKLVLKGMKIDSTTTTGQWSAEDENNDEIYTVDYKFRTSGSDQIFTWEVGKDSIKAINGKAIAITPELGPQEKQISGTENEKEIYEYSTNLYKKYESTFGSYEAETKTTSETAKKFGITEEEVEEIVSRLMDTKL